MSKEIFKFIKNGHVNAVRFMIAAGLNVNSVDENGNSLLHLVCFVDTKATPEQRLAMIKILVNAGADLFIKDSEGNLPLAVAKKNGCALVVDYLEKLHSEGKYAKDQVSLSTEKPEAVSRQQPSAQDTPPKHVPLNRHLRRATYTVNNSDSYTKNLSDVSNKGIQDSSINSNVVASMHSWLAQYYSNVYYGWEEPRYAPSNKLPPMPSHRLTHDEHLRNVEKYINEEQSVCRVR